MVKKIPKGVIPFEEWKHFVDMWIEGACGLCSDDLPDFDYRKAYDRGEGTRAVAMKAMRNAMEF